MVHGIPRGPSSIGAILWHSPAALTLGKRTLFTFCTTYHCMLTLHNPTRYLFIPFTPLSLISHTMQALRSSMRAPSAAPVRPEARYELFRARFVASL